MGNGAPGRGDFRRLPTRATSVTPGALFFCVPGFTRRRARLRRRRRSSAAPRRWSASGRSGSACPRWSCDDVRAAMAPAAARFYGDPDARAARRGHHRHQRQDHHGLPGARTCSRRPGVQTRAARHGQVASWAAREEEVERTTPEAIDLQATFRRMLDARRPRLRDGGLLARARAGPRRRASASPAGSSPTSPRTTSTSTTTMEAYFAAKRRLFEGDGGRRGGERRRRLRPPAGGGARRTRSPSRSSARPTTARCDVAASTRAARASRCETPDGRARARVAAARAVQRAERAGGGGRRARAGRAARDAIARRSRAPIACPAASSRSTRARTSACSWTTPTRPTRSRTCCAPRAS